MIAWPWLFLYITKVAIPSTDLVVMNVRIAVTLAFIVQHAKINKSVFLLLH